MKTTDDFSKIVNDKDYYGLVFAGDINKEFHTVHGDYTPLGYAIIYRNYLIPTVLYHGASFDDFDLNMKRLLFNLKFDVIKHFGFKMPFELFFETTNKDFIEYGTSQGLVIDEFYKRYKESDFSDKNIVNSKGQTLLAYAIEMKNIDAIDALLKIGAPFKIDSVKDEIIADETVKDEIIKDVAIVDEIIVDETVKDEIIVDEIIVDEIIEDNVTVGDDFEIILTNEISDAIEKNNVAEILVFMSKMNNDEKTNIINHISCEKIKNVIKMLTNIN